MTCITAGEPGRAGRAVQRPKRLHFPVIVKSLTQESSIGISQASVVETDEKLRERVHFIHRSVGTDAIVERYIAGRELYVGIVGNLAVLIDITHTFTGDLDISLTTNAGRVAEAVGEGR